MAAASAGGSDSGARIVMVAMRSGRLISTVTNP
jgi:hypothetical protein